MRFAIYVVFAVMFGLPFVPAEEVEIKIDGRFDDWNEIKAYSDPEGDTFGGVEDPTLDILECRIANDDQFLYVFVTVKDDIANGKTSRGAYQTVIDADNNYDTGIQSDKEAPYPPHEKPLGVDFYISVETKQGVYQGVELHKYEPDAVDIGQEEDVLGAELEAVIVGNKYELKCDLKSLGIQQGDTIRLSILHYSAAGTVDWIIPPIDYVLGKSMLNIDPESKLAAIWGYMKRR